MALGACRCTLGRRSVRVQLTSPANIQLARNILLTWANGYDPLVGGYHDVTST